MTLPVWPMAPAIANGPGSAVTVFPLPKVLNATFRPGSRPVPPIANTPLLLPKVGGAVEGTGRPDYVPVAQNIERGVAEADRLYHGGPGGGGVAENIGRDVEIAIRDHQVGLRCRY